VNHFASPEFWFHYRQLPPEIRELADKNFDLLKSNPRQHPSLRLKKMGAFWSARVGRRYRALAKERPEGLVWFWVGPHDRYDFLLRPN
jgi:mRNA-degrading endonuclease RelE of RelBE toxin-antitoxin system